MITHRKYINEYKQVRNLILKMNKDYGHLFYTLDFANWDRYSAIIENGSNEHELLLYFYDDLLIGLSIYHFERGDVSFGLRKSFVEHYTYIIKTVESSHFSSQKGPLKITACDSNLSQIMALKSNKYLKLNASTLFLNHDLKGYYSVSLPETYSIKTMENADDTLIDIRVDIENQVLDRQINRNDYKTYMTTESYNPKFDFLIIDSEGNGAAIVCCLIDYNSGIATFEPVGVSEKHRGHKLSSSLCRYAMNHLVDLGIKKIILGTEAENTISNQLYKNLGFNEYDTESTWIKKVSN